MVPGEFNKPIPCFIARPLRGLTCSSYPSGTATDRPVGMRALSPAERVISLSGAAYKSIPDDPSVI